MELLSTSKKDCIKPIKNLKRLQLTLLTLALTVISIGASGQTKNSNPNVVTINYSNEINGYSVRIFWKPIEVRNTHTKGPAILEFYNNNDSTSFFLTNNHFGIENRKLPFTYSEDYLDIVSIDENEIGLEYHEDFLISEYSFGTTNEPFFFQDLDFDDREELIFVELANGQRGLASFKAFKFDYSEYNNLGLQPELYGITSKEPFKSLDEMSEVDYLNQQIKLYKSGGSCANSYEIYKLQPGKNEFEGNSFFLETLVEEYKDEKSKKCYELTYSVIGQSKKLLSKKEINE
jgi:hypothetical protein